MKKTSKSDWFVETKLFKNRPKKQNEEFMLSYGGLEEVLKLLYLDLSSLSFLPKGMVVNNIGPGLLADLNYCRQPIPLIAQLIFESPNCAW